MFINVESRRLAAKLIKDFEEGRLGGIEFCDQLAEIDHNPKIDYALEEICCSLSFSAESFVEYYFDADRDPEAAAMLERCIIFLESSIGREQVGIVTRIKSWFYNDKPLKSTEREDYWPFVSKEEYVMALGDTATPVSRDTKIQQNIDPDV